MIKKKLISILMAAAMVFAMAPLSMGAVYAEPGVDEPSSEEALPDEVTGSGDEGVVDLTEAKAEKAPNTLSVEGKRVQVKYTSVKKKTQKLPVSKVIIFFDKGQGKKTYTKYSGTKKITVNKKTGKVTIKKGLKKGTYKVKVKVKAAGNSEHKPSAVKKVTITIKVTNNIVETVDTQQYSTAEIKEMANAGLSLDEAADEISTISDAINYLKASGYFVGRYSFNPYINYNNIEWTRGLSADFTYEKMAGTCAGTANLLNRLLKDDFDEEGYVEHRNSRGGHVFNYFKRDGVYYFCDFVNPAFTDDPYSYLKYKTTDPEDFGQYYLNRAKHNNDISSEFYIMNLYMYSRNGKDNLACGFDPNHIVYTPLDAFYSDQIPNTVENLKVLFIRDDFLINKRSGPPETPWPSEENVPED